VLSTPTIAPYLQSVGVPAIGGTLAEENWFTNPDFFPEGSEAQIGNYIGVKVGIERGLTKVGVIYCVEFALLCSTDAQQTEQNASQLGGQVVYDEQVSLAQPDYTSECLSAKNAGVNNFEVILEPNSMVRFVNDCAIQGYHPYISTAGLVFDSTLLGTPNTNGMVAGASVFPFSVEAPATAVFNQAFQQITGSAPNDEFEAMAWVSGLILQAAGKDLPANPTPADVINGLDQIKNDTFGGLTVPITYMKNQATPTQPCAWPLVINNGAFTAPGGMTPTCLASTYGVP
jgi:branched-chain amino acid transport system substrate-binding protein